MLSKSAAKRSNLPMLIGGFFALFMIQLPSHWFSRGHTRPQMDGKFVRSAKISLAKPKLPFAIAWMKRGISFSIGQPIRHNGFGQFRQRFASASASSIV